MSQPRIIRSTRSGRRARGVPRRRARGVPRPRARRARPAAWARWFLLGVLPGLGLGCTENPETRRLDSRLVVAIPRDGGPINPYSGSGDFLLGLVYDKLMEPSPYVEEPWPGLATEATQTDSVTWSVPLRSGVTWHDGTPFTAEDVAFSFGYYRDGPPNRYGHHVSQVPWRAPSPRSWSSPLPSARSSTSFPVTRSAS